MAILLLLLPLACNGNGDGYLNLSSKALGFRSKTCLRAAFISFWWEEVLWQSVHRHFRPHIVLKAKHWQYNLRHLDFLQVHEPSLRSRADLDKDRDSPLLAGWNCGSLG